MTQKERILAQALLDIRKEMDRCVGNTLPSTAWAIAMSEARQIADEALSKTGIAAELHIKQGATRP